MAWIPNPKISRIERVYSTGRPEPFLIARPMGGPVPYQPQPTRKKTMNKKLLATMLVTAIACTMIGALISTFFNQPAKSDEEKRTEWLNDTENLEYGVVDKTFEHHVSVTQKRYYKWDGHYYEHFTLKVPADLKDKVHRGCEIVYHEGWHGKSPVLAVVRSASEETDTLDSTDQQIKRIAEDMQRLEEKTRALKTD